MGSLLLIPKIGAIVLRVESSGQKFQVFHFPIRSLRAASNSEARSMVIVSGESP